MYLSKLILDIKNKSVQQALTDCEDMHRNVQKIFNSSRTDAGVLYRIVSKENSAGLYILSNDEITEAMMDINNGITLVNSRNLYEFENAIEEGKRYRFDLLANPSKKVSQGEGKNSRRISLHSELEQIEWIEKKSKLCGFDINSVTVRNGGTIISRKKEKVMKFSSANYYGVITITDREKFIKTWKFGIGPEKAYGMGMMIING